MAKFLVTNGSYFEPFTYDELAKPIMQTVEAHNAAQDAYDAIGMETAALSQYISENPGDSDAKALYDNYMGKLSALQNNLWTNGYTPQVRRDLSNARMDYFQNIGKLKGAIERRQKESDAYYEAKRKDHDSIMGRDPGSYGLNEYLRDSNFGRDWFSYSGKEFEAGVGTEIKARAAELKRASIASGNGIPGYITRIESDGFTNAETFEGGNLAMELLDMSPEQREAYYAEHRTSAPVQIISESIISRYNATGARQADLDDYARSRFIEYGTRGAAQGVLGKKYKEFDDKVFDQEQKKDMALYNHNLAKDMADYNHRLAKDLEAWKAEVKAKSGGNGGGSGSNQPRIMGETLSMQSPGYEKWVKATEGENKYFREGDAKRPYQITLPHNQGSKSIGNEYEMAEELYGTKSREDIRKKLSGYDIALDPGDNREITVKTDDGRTITYKASRPTDEQAKRLGIDKNTGVVFKEAKTGQIDDDLSREVSDASSALAARVQSYKDVNPDIEKMAVSPKKQKELREKNEYPERAPWKDFYSYMSTKETVGDFSPAILVGHDTAHAYVRENLANEFIGQFNKEADANGNVGKGSRFAVHVVNDGHMTMSEQTVNNLGEVLGRTKDGKIRNDTLTDVYAVPDDFIGQQFIRFGSTAHEGTEFAVSPIAFGPMVQNIYNSTGSLVQAVMEGLDPKRAMKMSPDEAIRWGYNSYQILGSDPDNFPLVRTPDGRAWRPVTPMEVLRNPEYQRKIRQAIQSELTQPALSAIREEIGINHEQHVGDTNANAEGYY